MKKPEDVCNLDGLYLADGEQDIQYDIAVRHDSQKCTSTQLFKGILDNHSRAAFNGAIRVAPGAGCKDHDQTTAGDICRRCEMFAWCHHRTPGRNGAVLSALQGHTPGRGANFATDGLCAGRAGTHTDRRHTYPVGKNGRKQTARGIHKMFTLHHALLLKILCISFSTVSVNPETIELTCNSLFRLGNKII